MDGWMASDSMHASAPGSDVLAAAAAAAAVTGQVLFTCSVRPTTQSAITDRLQRYFRRITTTITIRLRFIRERDARDK